MSEYAERFIIYLSGLHERDRGAMARLRRSLAFAPGTWPSAYPYVERFVPRDCHALDSKRLALYAVAGLFARHPHIHSQSFASALGTLMRKRDSASIEQRFIALLGAQSDNISGYLRQIISLLAADDIGFDYAGLLDDLQSWMNPHHQPDRVRQRWARDFYRAIDTFDPPAQ